MLLLKAAMPMLASTAAQVQGKALVEVCTTYGVSLVAPDGTAPDPDSGPGAHAADHCVLSALPGLVPLDAAPLRVADPAAQESVASPSSASAETIPDAAARWAARLEHGPPVLA
jgi:hypothetical protein